MASVFSSVAKHCAELVCTGAPLLPSNMNALGGNLLRPQQLRHRPVQLADGCGREVLDLEDMGLQGSPATGVIILTVSVGVIKVKKCGGFPLTNHLAGDFDHGKIKRPVLSSHQRTWVCAQTTVDRRLSSWLVGLFAFPC